MHIYRHDSGRVVIELLIFSIYLKRNPDSHFCVSGQFFTLQISRVKARESKNQDSNTNILKFCDNL